MGWTLSETELPKRGGAQRRMIRAFLTWMNREGWRISRVQGEAIGEELLEDLIDDFLKTQEDQ